MSTTSQNMDGKGQENRLSKVESDILKCMTSHITKEIKSMSKQRGKVNIDVTVEKLQKAVSGNNKENAFKTMKHASKNASKVVERLGVHVVGPLLDMILDLVKDTPRNGTELVPWLHALLYHYSAYISSIPELNAKFDVLHKLINTRAVMYSRLLKLNGRLELFNELIKDHDSEEEEEMMEMVNSEESSEVFESEASDN